MAPVPPAPVQYVLLGDGFGAQVRDGVGLALRLGMDLGLPVLDRTVNGGIREVYREACALDAEMAQGGPGVGGLNHSILVIGGNDSRAGGTPVPLFLEGVKQVLSLLPGNTLTVLVPPCPIPSRGLRGYSKGARRWLTRVAPLLPDAFVPEIPDNLWRDQLNLRQHGIDALAKAIAAKLREK